MANIFFLSDTHFGHANILTFRGLNGELIRPGFASVEDMDEHMVTQWNATVRRSDHIYHLGDVAMDARHAASIVPRLNGYKRLILGNHDDDRRIALYRSMGFQKIGGVKKVDDLFLSHAPVHPESIPAWATGNVHGHLHERPSPPGRYCNVSVEAVAYTPIALEDIKQRLRARGE